MILRLSDTVRTAQLEAIRSTIDGAGPGALLSFYEGPAMLLCLARLPLALPCGTITAGSLVIAPIGEASAIGTGTAGWATIAANGGQVVLQCDVGTTDSVLILNTVDIVIGGPVKIDRFVIAAPE